MLLQRGGCHDGVHEELPALLVVTAACGSLLAALLPVLAPFIVHASQGVDFGVIDAAIVRIVGNGVFDRIFRWLQLQDGVDLNLLLNDLAQFQGRGLQNLQALLHLRPDGELLRLNLVESLVGHEWL